MRIAVMGAGAWGTALAITFSGRHDVALWARDPAQIEEMARCRENTRYLRGVHFPDSLEVTADFAAATRNTELLIVAAPLAGLRQTLVLLRDAGLTVPLIWVCKGLEAGSGLLPHQVVAEVLGERGSGVRSGVLTGPSFALELAKGLPTVVTLASRDTEFALDMADALHGPNLRIYATDDVIGAEIGGAVKNVMAIATGICDGMNLGMNARAALLTRGLAEITRLGIALGGRQATFMGLSGMGDLILTCTGDLSRNRRVGLLLASGKPLTEITRELGHVAEGVPAAREVSRRAREMNIRMPITDAVCAILDGDMTPQQGLQSMMSRAAGSE